MCICFLIYLEYYAIFKEAGNFIYFVMRVWGLVHSQLFIFISKFVNSAYFVFKRIKGSKM